MGAFGPWDECTFRYLSLIPSPLYTQRRKAIRLPTAVIFIQ